MKKYISFKVQRPPTNTLICWLNNQLKEVYGYYDPKLITIEINDGRKGYMPAVWRHVNEIEMNQFDERKIVTKRKK